jgi:hypothetical protein
MSRKSVKRFCDNDMRKNKGLKRGKLAGISRLASKALSAAGR